MTREKAAAQALKECFWGDYTLTTTDILARLDSDDAYFARFLFGKIAGNAPYPSQLIPALDEPPAILAILEQTAAQPRWRDLRHRFIRANLTGRRELVPEGQWKV